MNLKQEGKIGHQIISSPRFNHLYYIMFIEIY